MSKFRYVIGPCILGFLLFTTLGVYSIINPEALMNILSIIVGSFLILLGLWQIFLGTSKRFESMFLIINIFLGILLCTVGIIFIFYKQSPYLLFCLSFGIWALISGILKVSSFIQLKNTGEKSIFILIIGIIHIIFGVMMILFPIFFSELWFRILGIYWIYLGICFFATMFTKWKIYLV